MADIVIKSTLSGHFTIIANEFARNPAVTPRAARVFIYLMSNTEGWITSAERISKILEMGTGAVGGALRDLESLGYLKRERKNVDGGRFKWEYELYATPITTDEKASNGSTCGNDSNMQVGAIERFSTDGSSTNGKATSLRRSISKNTNSKETKEDISPSGDVNEVPKRSSYPESFETWWKIWPKRTSNKKSAYRQWVKAVERVHADDLNAKTYELRAFVEAGHQPVRFVKDAERWLRDDHWEDVLEVPQNHPQSSGGVPAGFKRINASERRMLETQMLMSQPDPRVAEALRTGLVPMNFGSVPQPGTQAQFQPTPQSMIEMEIR